jgi:hypothetical protein
MGQKRPTRSAPGCLLSPGADMVGRAVRCKPQIKEMRLVVKFGDKKRYSDREHEAIYRELVEAGLDDEARRDPDAIEAVFRKLNAANEAEAARRDLCG